MPSHLRQRLESSEAKEIVRHGVIGGVVAVILVTVDVLQQGPLRHWRDCHPWWFALTMLPLAFLCTFLSLALVESLLRLRGALSLPVVEDVADGIWVYKTKDAASNRWTRGSVTEISSTGWGFKVKGESFCRADLPTGSSSGNFHGEGSLWGDDKFNFRYRGSERKAQDDYQDDEGVGYYQFYRTEKGLCIRGAFTGLLGANHQMITRKLEGERVSRVRDDSARKKAKETLYELLQPEPVAYGFGGTWIDAIYEKRFEAAASGKWELVQGSIIEIQASELDSKSLSVKGWSYDLEDIKTSQSGNVTTNHHFRGEARLADSAKVLCYLFDGFEGTPGQGVARYEMHEDSTGQEKFVGEFSRGQERSLRIVFGKKIAELERNKQVQLLAEYLAECQERPPGFLGE